MGRKADLNLLKWDDMNAQVIRELSKEEFQEALAELVKLYRRGELFVLDKSPLLETPLFCELLLVDEPHAIATSRDLTEAVLTWGVGKLRPSGQQDWHAGFWRHYNVLHGFYLEGLSIAELAERMDIAEQTFYDWRGTALVVLGQLLYQESYHPQALFARRQEFVKLRYGHLEQAEQQMLTLIAASAEPLPVRSLFHSDDVDILQRLQTKHFLTFSEDLKTVSQPEELRQHVQRLTSEEQKQEAHETLAHKFMQAVMIQPALWHLYQSGQVYAVVQTAVTHEDTLFKQSNITELHALLGKVVDGDLQQVEPNLRAQFLLLSARAAAWVEALDLALTYSRQALAAPDIRIKIQAYYERAKLLHRVNLDECLSHYAVCLELIDRSDKLNGTADPELRRLATKMFIDRAWIFIQERPNYELAAEDLTQAEQIIPSADSRLWCDIYNAQAGLISRSQTAKAALPSRLKALTSAEASADIERMTKMAYNLGSGYMFAGDYENGRRYLHKSREWAIQSGNLQTLGLAYKGLGSCCFFTEAFDEAITHYEKAYEIWCETNNKNWQIYISYDLVEAYATVGRFIEARQQFETGKQLAVELGNERILQELQALVGQFPTLEVALSPRQAEALAYVDNHGRISRTTYIDLTGVAKSQAYRDLEEMCQLGLLQRVGKGRGTHYIRE